MSKLLHKLAISSLLGFPIFVILYRLELLALKPAMLGAVISSAGLGFVVLVVAMLYTFVYRRTKPAQVAQARRAAYISLLPVIALTWVMSSGGKYPPINDITTDIDNPATFVHAAKLRKPDDNALSYNPEFAVQQQSAWPNLKGIETALKPETAFLKTLSIAKELGWKVTYQDKEIGHIEAVEQTLLWGWRDDIVIRISENGELTKVDVRSCSRSGVGDLGVNAKRIKRFIMAFNG